MKKQKTRYALVFESGRIYGKVLVSLSVVRKIVKERESFGQKLTPCILQPFSIEDVCTGCGNHIDPEICHCGDVIKNHGVYCGHQPVPMGCTCGYSK